ncbi:MAG: ECF-type sigma factor [Bacteroidota bacterium]
MQYSDGNNLTLFLKKAQDGAATPNDSRWPLIYRKLHMIADRMMLSERNDHTLSVNGLIHETYLRLFSSSASWQNREHFYRSFSRTMKRTLIDYARNRNSLKREGRKNKLPIGDAVQVASEPETPAMELKLAVEQLAAFDARLAQVIEMRFFKQMSIQEIAKHMDVSTRTIDRDLNRAKLLLFRSLIAEHIPALPIEKTYNS